MHKNILVFKNKGRCAAFNRLTLNVAYGNDSAKVTSAVKDNKISLSAYRKRAAQQKVDFRVLYLILTNNCNFNCKYCYEKGLMPKSKDMSAELAKKSIDVMLYNLHADANKPYYLYFYGGEPLLNFPVLKSATLYFRRETSKLKAEAYVSVVTNGSVLTEEIVKFLKDNDVDLSISLDGNKSINDSKRTTKGGSSAYESASKAIGLAQSVGLKFDISFTIGYHNVDKIKEQVDFLENTFRPRRIILNVPVVRNMKDLRLAQKAFGHLIKLRKYLWDSNNTDTILPQFVRRFVDKEYGWRHCPCQRHQLVVRCDGVVGPCLLLQNNNTYFDHTIDELVRAYNENGPFKEFMGRVSVNIKECAKCPALMFCRGGCAANALNINGSLLKPDPLICAFANNILKDLVWSVDELRPENGPHAAHNTTLLQK